jgi:hypothetical protein
VTFNASPPANLSSSEVAVIVALFAVAAIVLFVLAGLNIGAPRFNPAWFGMACAAVVLFAPILQHFSH